MSGTFLSPIAPLPFSLSLSSTHHKHYTARSTTTTAHSSPPTPGPAPTSLAHDLLAKHSPAKWLQKQRREYEVNREIRLAKRDALTAEEVAVRERSGSESSTAAAEEGKMTAAFAG